MSKKGEEIMKPNKEQKGKNAVLVIAIGKHPKMGPGPRKEPNKKGVKKAMNLLKNDTRRRAERQKAHQARVTRRAERAKEDKAYEEGTASPELTDKINQSKTNNESGVNQNLRFAPKQSQGGSQSKRMPKKQSSPQKPNPLDLEVYDRWVKNNSLGDYNRKTKEKGSKITSENLQDLASKLKIPPGKLTRENINESGVDIGALKDAMKELGGKRYAQRQADKEQRGLDRGMFGEDKSQDRHYEREDNSPDDGSSQEQEEDMDAHSRRDSIPFEDYPPELQQRLLQARSFTPSDKAMSRLGRDDEESRVQGRDDISRQPSAEFTQDFAHSGKTMGGFAGGDLDKPLGRVMPKIPQSLSSPQEEEEEEDLPEYSQFATGEPMNIAMRLLKERKIRLRDNKARKQSKEDAQNNPDHPTNTNPTSYDMQGKPIQGDREIDDFGQDCEHCDSGTVTFTNDGAIGCTTEDCVANTPEMLQDHNLPHYKTEKLTEQKVGEVTPTKTTQTDQDRDPNAGGPGIAGLFPMAPDPNFEPNTTIDAPRPQQISQLVDEQGNPSTTMQGMRHPDIRTGEPMNIAFQLLKGMKKKIRLK